MLLTFRASEIDGGAARARPLSAWSHALDEVLQDPERLRTEFQPVVCLSGGRTVGYEALSRFGGRPVASPDKWFVAASRLGLGGLVEALAVERALEARADMDSESFVALNLSACAVLLPDVQKALLARQDLDHILIELTEQSAVSDYAGLAEALRPLREAGARVAVDDVGAGYGSLHRITKLRPDYVKVDRALVADVHRHPDKAAALATLAGFAGQMGAQVIAEGIEHEEELDEVIRLGVEFGQGFGLGVPREEIVPISAGLSARIRVQAAATREHKLAGVLERPPALGATTDSSRVNSVLAAHPETDYFPVIDPNRRPVGIVHRAAAERGEASFGDPLCVRLDSDVKAVARRALGRPGRSRAEPVVCCDEVGRYVGVVSFERLISQLL